jgi:lysophospholipase L1-like esterase
MVLTRATGGAFGGYARLTQNVVLEAGAYYQFRIKVRGDLRYCFLRMIEQDAGNYRGISDVSLDGTDTNVWRTFLLTMQATADTAWQVSVVLQQIPEDSTQTIWVDSIEVQKIASLSRPEYVVAAIGDSQVSHLGLDAKELNDNAYSFLLSSITRRQQAHTLEYMTPLNKGVAGNTSSAVASRIQADVVNTSPKPCLCYVAVGTNDASSLVNVATFRSNVISILNTLRNGGVTPILFTITPRTDAVDISAYNAELEDIAADENVALFDAHQVFLDTGSVWSSEWLDDALHYNKLGHQALGRALGDFIDANGLL